MFGKSKISPEAKQYAKAQAEANKQWRKFKETGNEKAHNKAIYSYGIRDALGMQLQNPKTEIKKTNVNIGNNNKFNKSKRTSVSVRASAKTKFE